MEYGAGLQDQYRAEENQTGPGEDSYQYTAGAFSSNSQAFVAFDPAIEGQSSWEGSPDNEMNWEATEESSIEPGEGSYQYTPNLHPFVAFDPLSEGEGFSQETENTASWQEAYTMEENPNEPAAGSYQYTSAFPPNSQPFVPCPPSMNGQGYWQQPFVSEINPAAPGDNSNQYAGAFFPRSKHFIVSGGHFTSNVTKYVTNPSPVAPCSNIRMILPGAIDLRREIRVEQNSGMVRQHRSANSAKRMYSARIDGCSLDMTIAIYQKWRQDLNKYSDIHHPNFLQIYGAAQSSGLHAVVFYDDLVPLEEMLDLYCNSPILYVYLGACVSNDFQDADHYFALTFNQDLTVLSQASMIRRSTGQLCLDLSPSNPKEHFKRVYYWQPIHTSMIPMPQLGPVPESIILSSFTLEEFHDCVRTSGSWESKWFCNIYTSVQLGSIVSWLDSKETMCHMESKFEYTDYGWTFNLGGSDVPQPVVTESGWSRIASWSLDGSLSRILFTTPFNLAIWLAQANHIFSTLQITSNQGTYCFVEGIQYSIHFPGTLDGIPRGYLFLCPLENLQTADETQFQHPDLPAYWSLDPSGIEKLSTEEAENLGFPPLEFTMEVHGIPWPEIAYSALRQFHQAKGFDPKSQDVARHLGYPLYQISPKWETRFAYVEEFVDPELPGSSSPRDLEIDEIEIMLQDIDFDETTLQTPDTSNHMNQSTEPAISCSHKLDSNRGVIAVAVERAQRTESQDVARHLGYPLYQETRFAYVEEIAESELPESSSPSDSEIDEIEIMLQDIDFDETTSQTSVTAHMNQSTEPATSCSHKLDSNRGVIAVAVERAQCLESWLDNDSLLAFIELLEKDPGAAEVYVVIEREAVRVKWVRRKLEMM